MLNFLTKKSATFKDNIADNNLVGIMLKNNELLNMHKG